MEVMWLTKSTADFAPEDSLFEEDPHGRMTGFPPTSLPNWQVDDLRTTRSMWLAFQLSVSDLAI
jgi:hypothetical protein